jgi:hypothetical protein
MVKRHQTLPRICITCRQPPGPEVTFKYAPMRLTGCWDDCDACRQKARDTYHQKKRKAA